MAKTAAKTLVNEIAETVTEAVAEKVSEIVTEVVENATNDASEKTGATAHRRTEKVESVIENIPMPTGRGRSGYRGIYDFDKLEIGQCLTVSVREGEDIKKVAVQMGASARAFSRAHRDNMWSYMIRQGEDADGNPVVRCWRREDAPPKARKPKGSTKRIGQSLWVDQQVPD